MGRCYDGGEERETTSPLAAVVEIVTAYRVALVLFRMMIISDNTNLVKEKFWAGEDEEKVQNLQTFNR